MLYATTADFLTRYDARLIADLASDTGTAVQGIVLSTNANVVAAVTDASADIDAALFMGDRYTPAQLESLSDTAASLLRRLASDIALIYMKRRRGKFDPEKDGALLKEITERLNRLRNGENYLMLSTDSEAEASTLLIVRPKRDAANRAVTIKGQTRNYYPANPDFNMPAQR